MVFTASFELLHSKTITLKVWKQKNRGKKIEYATVKNVIELIAIVQCLDSKRLQFQHEFHSIAYL